MNESPWPPTCMFQESRGSNQWRIQTDDPAIVRKLKRKKGFRLAMEGMNSNLHVFTFNRSRPEYARKAFTRILGRKIFFEATSGTYYAKTPPRVDSKSTSVTVEAVA